MRLRTKKTNIKKLNFLALCLILASSTLIPLMAHAAGSGFAASDVLGQLDGNGSPDFTTGDRNHTPSPNKFGFIDTEGNMSVDSADHLLFVPDDSENRVLAYALDSSGNLVSHAASYVLGQPDFVTSDANTTQDGMGGAFGTAYDPVHNRLFVSDDGNSRVLVYNLSGGVTNGMNATMVLGQPDFTTANANTTQDGMRSVEGLAYDVNHNRLFVSDYGNDRVLVFDGNNLADGMNASYVLGQPDFTSSDPNTTQDGMKSVASVAYDATNNRLVVADAYNNRVLLYDGNNLADGMNASYVLGQPDFTTSTSNMTGQAGMAHPWDVVYDSTQSYLYVDNNVNGGRILVYDLSGGVTDNMNAAHVLGQPDFTTNNTNTTQAGVIAPDALALDVAHHRLYVGDNGNRILVYNLSGGITDGMDAIDVLGQTNPDDTPNFTTSGDDNQYHFSASYMNYPASSVVDTVHHHLFVLDSSNRRILVYNLDSNNNLTGHAASYVLGQPDFTTNNTNTTQAGIGGLYIGMTYDPVNNRLFVSDEGNNRVLVYNLSGGISNGMDAAYVLGQPDFTTANPGTVTQNGFAGEPEGLAIDTVNQRLFVSDASSERVMVFDVSPGTIHDGMDASNVIGQPDFTTTASNTTQDGLEDFQEGVGVDPTRNILYVADDNNNRIMVYNLSGGITNGMNATMVLGQPDFTSGGRNASQTELSDPEGAIGIDPANNRIYVSDSSNNRVLVFNLAKLTAANALPAAHIGTAYSHVLGSQTQGTTTYSVTSGSLPDGLSLDAGTGALSGTPVAAGSFNFTVKLVDDNGTVGTFTTTQAYTLVVSDDGGTGGSSGGSTLTDTGVDIVISTAIATVLLTTGGVVYTRKRRIYRLGSSR